MLIIVGNAEARKMFENGDEFHQSSTRFVRRFIVVPDSQTKKEYTINIQNFILSQ